MLKLFTDNQKSALMFLQLVRDAQESDKYFREVCKSGVPAQMTEDARNASLENLGAFLNDDA